MTGTRAAEESAVGRNPRQAGGGEEACTCHLPGNTYPQPGGGTDPDCPKHNPA